MRKLAALWSSIALLVSLVFFVRGTLAPNHVGDGYLLFPILAFAGAVAIYTGHLSGPWFKSITWLLNGIITAAFGFELIFDGRQFFMSQPFRFAIVLLLLAASLLNSIALYPKSPKRSPKIEPQG